MAHTGFLTGMLCVMNYCFLTLRIVSAHLRFIGKLELKVKDLDQLHGEINDVYASGAVEGYADKKLDSTTLAKEKNLIG